jgi:predicted O-linked N-acetylglucosamine transferase (SPINDLY family)
LSESAEADLQRGRELYFAGRFEDGLVHVRAALTRSPQAYGLKNLEGVLLRQLGRRPEALEALEAAIALAPGETGARANRVGVLVALGREGEAETALDELIALEPAVPSHRLQRAGLRQRAGDAAGAEAVLEAGLAAAPDEPQLQEAKVLLLRTSGRAEAAEAYLRALPAAAQARAWAQTQLGDLVAQRDRRTGAVHLRRAVAAEGSPDQRVLLAQTLGRIHGEGEGAALDEAYGVVREAMAAGPLNAAQSRLAAEVLTRVCAFDDFDRLGDFASLGRGWAEAGRHTALLWQMPRVRTMADRLELIEQHRIWGRAAQARAAAQPVALAPRPAGGPLRLGILSSDLRRHPVGYFALPLFDHRDPGVELFAYSTHRGPEDALQAHFAARSAFRWRPGAAARKVAETIAADGLDMLIELGGSTEGNPLEVMAWRLAPVQASWLGYPHSVGLSTIDGFVCDPFTKAADPRLMLERPLTLSASWIALGEAVSQGWPDAAPGLPEDRAGFLTFGTANSPHKYTREGLAAWARVTAAVPGARFAFVRPEAGAEAFRRHVLAAFAAEGVGAERVVFHPVRGGHMGFYDSIDITLDTFPLTGGTTTVEALWMGAPVVSLKGPATFERLSFSILSNLGLGDLVADDVAGFEAAALGLAADRGRRAALREGLREAIRASPLGRTADFARDLYAMVRRAVAGA